MRKESLQRISKETILQGITCIVLDMDGTLYRFADGAKNFGESRLKRVMLSRAIAFIREREASEEQAQEVFLCGLQDPVGLSQVCANRYGITRSDYFSVVWNIDPSGCIESEPRLQFVLESVAKQGVQLRLVTSAPKVWQENACFFLGIPFVFTQVVTGENFSTKSEVFTSYAGQFQPDTVLSIGDQYETDIAPALAVGMRGICVSGPQQLIEVLKGDSI